MAGMKAATTLVAVSFAVLLLAPGCDKGDWALDSYDSRLESYFVVANHRLPHSETLFLESGTYGVEVERNSHHPFQVILHHDNGLAATDDTIVGMLQLGKSVLLATGSFVVPQSGRFLLTVSGSDFEGRQGQWVVRSTAFSPRSAALP